MDKSVLSVEIYCENLGWTHPTLKLLDYVHFQGHSFRTMSKYSIVES